MAAAIARAMPVLPLVASISRSPGLISPRLSACLIMEIAGLSLTEPAGLFPSSFNNNRFEPVSASRCVRTRGVLPINCSTVGKFMDIPVGDIPRHFKQDIGLDLDLL